MAKNDVIPKDHEQKTKNDTEDLKAFIRKKKIQNKALKKIIDKLNPPEHRIK